MNLYGWTWPGLSQGRDVPYTLPGLSEAVHYPAVHYLPLGPLLRPTAITLSLGSSKQGNAVRAAKASNCVETMLPLTPSGPACSGLLGEACMGQQLNGLDEAGWVICSVEMDWAAEEFRGEALRQGGAPTILLTYGG